MKYFVGIIVIVVASAIVAGFFVMGSPKTERMRQFDDRRVNDLQSIQSQVVFFWQQKGTLAASLDELKDPLGGWTAPRDPETGAAYEYKKTSTLSFEMCAAFNLASDAETPGKYPPMMARPVPAEPYYGGPLFGNWEHAAGRVCFSRTIDPALYPVRSGAPVGAPVPAKPRVID